MMGLSGGGKNWTTNKASLIKYLIATERHTDKQMSVYQQMLSLTLLMDSNMWVKMLRIRQIQLSICQNDLL